MNTWQERHIHLAAMLIVAPIVAISVLAILATVGYARGFMLDDILFGISQRAGMVAVSTSSAWIASKKGRGIFVMALSFVIPLYALALRNKRGEYA